MTGSATASRFNRSWHACHGPRRWMVGKQVRLLPRRSREGTRRKKNGASRGVRSDARAQRSKTLTTPCNSVSPPCFSVVKALLAYFVQPPP